MGGVRWTEHLSGWMSLDQTDLNLALLEGRHRKVTLSAKLTIQIDDIDRFAQSKRAQVTKGVVKGPALGLPMTVKAGEFALLVPSSGLFDQLHRRMRYRLNLEDSEGRKRCLHGFKMIEDDPGSDLWSDTTTLFVQIYEGWCRTYQGPDAALARRQQRVDEAQRQSPERVAEDRDGDALAVAGEHGDAPCATAVLRISAGGFLRQLTTFRGTTGAPWSRLADVLQFCGLFGEGLAKVYVGPPMSDGRSSFPCDRLPPPWEGKRPGPDWQLVPERDTEDLDAGRYALERDIVPFEVDDLAFPLNLHHLRRQGREPSGDPVLLVPGSGVRAEMFYGEPLHQTMVDCLLEAGYDVWVENWRASIDFPNNSYTLDQAAKFDHPKAVEKVLAETGRKNLRAVVHCQGSIGFLLAALAGNLPQDTVSHVVSSAISLFFEVPSRTWLKQRTVLQLARRIGRGADAQWGIRAPAPAGKLYALFARLTERPCRNGPCKMANYMYGAGWDVLALHENLDNEVHAWCARELGYTPFSLIQQVAESCRCGHIVPAEPRDESTPASYLDSKPKIEGTRFAFIGGTHNFMFEPRGQERAAEFLREFGLPADFAPLDGYGHLDTFWGKNAADDVFPIILEALQASGTGQIPGPKWSTPLPRQRPKRAGFWRRKPHQPDEHFKPPPLPIPALPAASGGSGPGVQPPGGAPEAAMPGAV